MPEEFDYSELRNYLRGQVDMGDSEVFLDEPWTLVKPAARPAARPAPVPVSPAPSAPAYQPPASPAPSMPASAPAAPLFESPVEAVPAARPVVKKAASAFESADSLESFYAALKGDVVYTNVADLVQYEGPANPKVLLLLPGTCNVSLM